MYGTYEDVTAESFFEVQLNTEYRTQWDPSVLELRVVDPKPGDSGDVIYWQVKFPVSEGQPGSAAVLMGRCGQQAGV